jgi:predicted ArsR family transcriptional regulator
LNLVVEKLNQMNYHARWEAGAEGPRILFGHCPYAAIIARHPELCKMDASLLEELMGRSATQTSKIGRDGSLLCVFVLG